MIPRLCCKWSQDRKWSPDCTVNDPRTGNGRLATKDEICTDVINHNLFTHYHIQPVNVYHAIPYRLWFLQSHNTNCTKSCKNWSHWIENRCGVHVHLKRLSSQDEGTCIPDFWTDCFWAMILMQFTTDLYPSVCFSSSSVSPSSSSLSSESWWKKSDISKWKYNKTLQLHVRTWIFPR